MYLPKGEEAVLKLACNFNYSGPSKQNQTLKLNTESNGLEAFTYFTNRRTKYFKKYFLWELWENF